MNGQELYINHGDKIIAVYFGPLLVAVLVSPVAPAVSAVAFAVSLLVMCGLVAIDVWEDIR